MRLGSSLRGVMRHAQPLTAPLPRSLDVLPHRLSLSLVAQRVQALPEASLDDWHACCGAVRVQ
jgi:hypothetical protein